MRVNAAVSGLCSVALLLGGCSSLASSGPSVSAVEDRASEDEVSRYMLVEVDPHTIEIVSARPSASLFDRFGNDAMAAAPDLRIGIGDQVAVTIWEVGSGGLFTGGTPAAQPGADGSVPTGSTNSTLPPQIVSRDGNISVPFAGRVHVAGLTPDAAAAAIQGRLKGQAQQPQVIVTVPTSVSGNVTVMGDVTGAARVALSVRGDRLLDVIAAAGGVKTPVPDTVIQLTRDGRTAVVPLKALLDDPRENIYAHPGDVITVSGENRTYTVLGATGQNSVIPFDAANVSLVQALGKGGGLLDNRADARGVFVFRYETPELARSLDPRNALPEAGQPVPVVYRLDLHDPKSYFLAQHFPIDSGDVIYVSNAPFSEIQKTLSLFQTVAQPVISGAALYGIVKRN